MKSSISFLLWATTSASTVYKTEFARLTKEGCVACQTSGFGWSDALSKCGGFSNSASQCQGKWDEGLQMNADAQEGQEGQEVPEEEIEWADTSTTSQFHNIISSGNIDAFVSLLKLEPESAKVRSADGRGPLFWAFEYNMLDMQSLLIQHGADADAKDARGQSPAVLPKKQVKRVVKKKVENIRSVEEEEEEEEEEEAFDDGRTWEERHEAGMRARINYTQSEGATHICSATNPNSTNCLNHCGCCFFLLCINRLLRAVQSVLQRNRKDNGIR
jgi:hypothetical protein